MGCVDRPGDAVASDEGSLSFSPSVSNNTSSPFLRLRTMRVMNHRNLSNVTQHSVDTDSSGGGTGSGLSKPSLPSSQ